MSKPHSVLWKRLEPSGHDACRFTATHDGWIVEGCAVFEHAKNAACLTYRLVCDAQWRSLNGSVTGWVGAHRITLDMRRDDAGVWRINGNVREDLCGLEDIDLGFTPASNTNAIRRLNLNVDCKAESTAVWLDTADWTVKPLTQTYHRIGEDIYRYTSPLHHFQTTLRVDDCGAVTEYPGLWLMLTESPPSSRRS